MAILKTLLTFLLVGAFVGLATASYAGPKFLEWNNTTTFASVQTNCNLPEVIRKVASELLHYQVMGTLIGSALFLVAGIALVVVRRNRAARPPPPQATPAG